MGIVTLLSLVMFAAVMAILLASRTSKTTTAPVQFELVDDHLWMILTQSFEHAVAQFAQNQTLSSAPGTDEHSPYFPPVFKTQTIILTDRAHRTFHMVLGLHRQTNKLYVLVQETNTDQTHHRPFCDVVVIEQTGPKQSQLSVEDVVFFEGPYQALTNIFFGEVASTLSQYAQEGHMDLQLYQTKDAVVMQNIMFIEAFSESAEQLNLLDDISKAFDAMAPVPGTIATLPAEVFYKRLWSYVEHHASQDGVQSWLAPLSVFFHMEHDRYHQDVVTLLTPSLLGNDVELITQILSHAPELLKQIGGDPVTHLQRLYQNVEHNVLGEHLSVHYGDILAEHLTSRRLPIALRTHFLNAASHQPKEEFAALLHSFMNQCSVFEINAYVTHLNKYRPQHPVAMALAVADFSVVFDKPRDDAPQQETRALFKEAVQLMQHVLTESWMAPKDADQASAALLRCFYQDGILWDAGDIDLSMSQSFTKLVIALRDHGEIASLQALYETRHDPRSAGLIQSSIDKVIKQMEKRLREGQDQLIGSLSLNENTGQAGDLSIAAPTEGQLSMTDDVPAP